MAQPGLSDDLRALALLEFGVAELWTGRFEAAERHLEQALAIAQRIERPFLELGALAHLAQIAIFRSLPRRPSAARRRSNSLSATAGRTILSPASRTRSTVSRSSFRDGSKRRNPGCSTPSVRAPWVSPAGGLMLYVMRGLLEPASGDDADALTAFRSAERLGENLADPHVLAARTPGTCSERWSGWVSSSAPRRSSPRSTTRSARSRRCGSPARRCDSPATTPRRPPRARAGAGRPALAMRPRTWPVQALLLEAIARDALGDTDRPSLHWSVRSTSPSPRACSSLPPLPSRGPAGAASAASHLARGADLRDPRPAGRKDTAAATRRSAPLGPLTRARRACCATCRPICRRPRSRVSSISRGTRSGPTCGTSTPSSQYTLGPRPLNAPAPSACWPPTHPDGNSGLSAGHRRHSPMRQPQRPAAPEQTTAASRARASARRRGSWQRRSRHAACDPLRPRRSATATGRASAQVSDMSASFVVGLAIRSAPEWVICAARRAADRPYVARSCRTLRGVRGSASRASAGVIGVARCAGRRSRAGWRGRR